MVCIPNRANLFRRAVAISDFHHKIIMAKKIVISISIENLQTKKDTCQSNFCLWCVFSLFDKLITRKFECRKVERVCNQKSTKELDY